MVWNKVEIILSYSYLGQITLLMIAMMQICECSASTCLAALSSLNSETFDMKRWARGSKSYYMT
jgi:hypothetical protein